MISTKKILNGSNEEIFVETYCPLNAKETIVFCHGITGCRKGRTMNDTYFQDFAKKLMTYDYKVVLFDFSGHGESEGNDFDVCLSKSTDELKRVFLEEVSSRSKVSFLAFSYGAIVLDNFLNLNQDIEPEKIVLISPCINPLESCFLNPNSIFGKDIVEGYENGTLAIKGYSEVGAKNFRFGLKMIDECKKYTTISLKKFHDRILLLIGTKDVILNTEYNIQFCKENNIAAKYYNASHSLVEDIDNVINDSINYMENR